MSSPVGRNSSALPRNHVTHQSTSSSHSSATKAQWAEALRSPWISRFCSKSRPLPSPPPPPPVQPPLPLQLPRGASKELQSSCQFLVKGGEVGAKEGLRPSGFGPFQLGAASSGSSGNVSRGKQPLLERCSSTSSDPPTRPVYDGSSRIRSSGGILESSDGSLFPFFRAYSHQALGGDRIRSTGNVESRFACRGRFAASFPTESSHKPYLSRSYAAQGSVFHESRDVDVGCGQPWARGSLESHHTVAAEHPPRAPPPIRLGEPELISFWNMGRFRTTTASSNMEWFRNSNASTQSQILTLPNARAHSRKRTSYMGEYAPSKLRRFGL